MTEEPEFLRKAFREAAEAHERLQDAEEEWRAVKEAMKSFPEFKPTGERRAPKAGEWIIDRFNMEPYQMKTDYKEADIRFILRKVEPEKKPEWREATVEEVENVILVASDSALILKSICLGATSVRISADKLLDELHKAGLKIVKEGE